MERQVNPRRTNFQTLNVDRDLYAQLSALAEKESRSRVAIVRLALKQYAALSEVR